MAVIDRVGEFGHAGDESRNIGRRGVLCVPYHQAMLLSLQQVPPEPIVVALKELITGGVDEELR